MITRDQALNFLNQKLTNKNIISHMIALEYLMAGIYEALLAKGNTDLGGTKEEYRMAGLLHDGDYTEAVPMEKQGIEVTNWLRAEGYEIPENVAHAMAAHNADNTGVQPQNLMDWTINIGDSLTGLIVASALVLPTKKLADVQLKSVLKRFKEPAFARGTRRDQIALCEEKLGIPLPEFIELSLKAMQAHSAELGL